jgi:Zn-dependent protease
MAIVGPVTSFASPWSPASAPAAAPLPVLAAMLSYVAVVNVLVGTFNLVP